jgi:hypothetical protein
MPIALQGHMENEPMGNDNASIEGAAEKGRKGIWLRLHGRGLLHETDLIRIHRIAQQQHVSPEVAAIALGVNRSSKDRQDRRPLVLGNGHEHREEAWRPGAGDPAFPSLSPNPPWNNNYVEDREQPCAAFP